MKKTNFKALGRYIVLSLALLMSTAIFGRTRAEIINSRTYSPELLELANKGDVEAQNTLGNVFKYGMGVEQNLEYAVFWYEKAAALGSPGAMYNLGNMYLGALGVEKDVAKAVELYEQAASKDQQAALLMLAKLHLEGLGVEKNFEKSFEYAMRAANAPISLVTESEQGGKVHQKTGEAEFLLAAMYADGVGTTVDKELSLKYLKQAAVHDFIPACNHLAEMYEKGEGVARDTEQARIWREKAAALSSR